MVWRELPKGWAEEIGIAAAAPAPSSAGGAPATTAAAAAAAAATAANATTVTANATAAATATASRPYEEGPDVALAAAALALLAKSSPIEKLVPRYYFWQPEEDESWRRLRRRSPPKPPHSRAAPRTLGALSSPWPPARGPRRDSENGGTRPGAGSRARGLGAPAPRRRPPSRKNRGLLRAWALCPNLKFLRLVERYIHDHSPFLLSRAAFESVRPSTLHFIKTRGFNTPFAVAADNDLPERVDI